MTSIFKIIGSILLGGSAIAAFFLGRKNGLQKADEEITEYKTYAEKEIASAKTEAAKATVTNKKLTAEKTLMKDAGSIVAEKKTTSLDKLAEAVSSATSDEELQSAISDIVADSAKKAQEAKKRYE